MTDNKKKWIKIGAIALVVVILLVMIISSYNGLVNAEETVSEKWSTIDVQLQRRNDLIPNLVSTVKGYALHEQETYTAVTEARNAYAAAGDTNEKVAAAAQLESALDIWVNAVTENYPELKANENFVALQDELAGTENRISVARQDYNKAAKEYNTSIRKFPKSIFASLFGFEKANYFEAAAGAENAPTVDFSK